MTPPTNLPPLPEPNKGYHYEYRGSNWDSKVPTNYIFIGNTPDSTWIQFINEKWCSSGCTGHYFEMVKDDWTLEEQIAYAKSCIGKTFLFHQSDKRKIVSMGVACQVDYLNLPSLINDELCDKGTCVYLVDNMGSKISVNNDSYKEVPTFIEVELNDDYTAKVYKNSIEVGCQTFPIGIIAKLRQAQEDLR